jgi:hypothetical protein
MGGFGKAQSQRTLFGSLHLLILVESQNKPKQTSPKYTQVSFRTRTVGGRSGTLGVLPLFWRGHFNIFG